MYKQKAADRAIRGFFSFFPTFNVRRQSRRRTSRPDRFVIIQLSPNMFWQRRAVNHFAAASTAD
jgi:hypothetical protein